MAYPEDVYIDLAFLKEYSAKQGYSVGADNDIIDAVVKATRYVDSRYGHRLKGIRAVDNQYLEFPRIGFFLLGVQRGEDRTNAPDRWKRAVAEYANMILNDQDNWNKLPGNMNYVHEAKIHQKMEKVGPIVEMTVYEPGSGLPVNENAATEPVIDDKGFWLVREYLRPGGRVTRG